MKDCPELRTPDGAPMLCGAPKLTKKRGEPCRRKACYPDKRCCLHTEWLEGNGDERKRADSARGKLRPRAQAWRIFRAMLNSADDLSIATPGEGARNR